MVAFDTVSRQIVNVANATETGQSLTPPLTMANNYTVITALMDATVNPNPANPLYNYRNFNDVVVTQQIFFDCVNAVIGNHANNGLSAYGLSVLTSWI